MPSTHTLHSHPPSDTQPSIIEFPNDTIVMEGETVLFAPKVAGSPFPTIAWYHNGSMVATDYSIDLSEDGRLTIISAEPRHAGTYRFTVSNNAGSLQGQVSLFVKTDSMEQSIIDQGAVMVDSDPVFVTEFGMHVADKHASQNKGFRDQYLVGWGKVYSIYRSSK